MITDSGQDKTTGSHHCFKGDHVNMYIAKESGCPTEKKVYFHTWAENKNKPIFFTFGMGGGLETTLWVLCVILLLHDDNYMPKK